MTTGKWYTPSGRSIQKEQPDSEAVPELMNETITVDGTPVIPEAPDTAAREQYRTASGRIVYGGGGIVPDLIVQPDTLMTAEKEFFDAASKAGNTYADVLFRYAVDYVRANPSLQPGFSITPQMEVELFNLLVAEGVSVTLEQLQNARRLVHRQVGLEIAQARWGQEGRAQRANRDDNVIRTAVQLLQRAPTQGDLFTVSSVTPAR
jgi:carboxyl-terminal processing protease